MFHSGGCTMLYTANCSSPLCQKVGGFKTDFAAEHKFTSKANYQLHHSSKLVEQPKAFHLYAVWSCLTMCYLNRTANTCSICISNSDRLGCGSVQRSTWAGLTGYNYWACYKYRSLFHTVPLPGNAGHVLPLGEILKSKTDRQRLKPMNDLARIKGILTGCTNGFKRTQKAVELHAHDQAMMFCGHELPTSTNRYLHREGTLNPCQTSK